MARRKEEYQSKMARFKASYKDELERCKVNFKVEVLRRKANYSSDLDAHKNDLDDLNSNYQKALSQNIRWEKDATTSCREDLNDFLDKNDKNDKRAPRQGPQRQALRH